MNETLNLLEVNFNLTKKKTLDVNLNGDLSCLFESEEEFISLVNVEALKELLFPLVNEIITRAKEINKSRKDNIS